MNHLSSQELLVQTKSLVAQERKLTLQLIEHLEEIQRRRLHVDMGFASLWEFATQELGLSEGAAQRRIQAMRLVRDVPEAKASLESGRLSLSNAAKVQSFRQAEKKLGRRPDARTLVSRVENLSQRECEKTLFEISPKALPRERERIVSASEERELKLVVSPALYEKLQKLRGLLAHAKPEASYAELLEHLADAELARMEKKRGLDQEPSEAITAAAAVEGERRLPAGRRVHLPAAVQRAVWARAGGRCEVEGGGARRCSSQYRLEIDHIRPLALGGENTLSNLRLACREHNVANAKNSSPRTPTP